MRTLIWKEWHEQSWKLGFGCIVLSAMAFIGLRSRIMPDEQMMQVVCFIGFMLLPVLTCSGLIPAERGDRTLRAIMALPITTRRIVAVKTVAGLLLCGGPIVVAGAISVFVAGNREMPTGAIVELYARSMLTALSLFIWIQSLTIRLPSEARAAMLSIGIVVMWLMLSAGFDLMEAPRMVQAVSPFAFIYALADIRTHVPPVWMALPAQAAIAWGSYRLSSRSLAFDSGV
jgi:ABC-type transport system involved in multi-copper enzyme maturation permease subunit